MVTLQVKDLRKSFGKLQVLDKLSLEIQKGGVFAVLGPNGSGKTTLLKSILGMVVPEQGDILFDGQTVLRRCDYRNRLNYLPQIANFPANLSVQELIKMVQNLRPKPSHPNPLLDLFGLVPSLPKKLGHLSGGTKQKVNLLLTFMFDSELYILDEPTTGLDPLSVLQLKGLIAEQKEKGHTVLFTTHIMSLVEEIADEIVFLLEGKIHFQGSVATLLGQTQERSVERAVARLMTGDVQSSKV
ncbi:MAG: ABC transporter ATP-binding protein [Vulcanimicrobiota bacterium]